MEFLVAGSVTSAISVGASSVAGVGRGVNQDALLAGPSWFVVADGVGGHAAGDVASAMAVDLFAGSPVPVDHDDLRRLIVEINAAIHSRALDGEARRMATTVVGTAVIGNELTVFHLGDSRCYRSVADTVELVTRDHSYVQELVDAGVLPDDEARTHRRRNVITRALGVDPLVQPDIVTVGAADRLLLCTDGVSSVLSVADISAVLSRAFDPQAAANRLIEAAVASGSRDDATALVVDGLAVP